MAAFTGALFVGVLAPRSAWALPGPEIVLPAAVAIAQAWAILAWATSRVSRGLGRSRWRGRLFVDLGVAALCVLAAQERGLLLVFALGLFGLRDRPRLRLGLVAAGLGAFALVDLGAWASRRSAPARAYEPDAPVAVVRGRPGAVHEALRSDARVLLVGEREDFANCWVPGATLVRPADVSALRAVDPRDPYRTIAVLGAASGERTVDELEARGARAVRIELRESDPAVACEATFAGGLLRPLMPFRGLWRYPNIPGERLAGVPYVRPRELASYGSAASVPAYEVALTPTAQLRGRYGARPAIVRGDDLGSVVTATRLLQSAGVRVLAAAPERDEGAPVARSLLTVSRALLVASVAALMGFALSALLGRREERALVAYARGASREPSLVWAATLPFAPGALAALVAGATRADASMHALVTPSAFGSHTALHVAAFGALLVVPVREARHLPVAQRVALQSALVVALGAAMWASVATHAVTLLAALLALPCVLVVGAHRSTQRRVRPLLALARADLGAKARELARAATSWLVPPGRVVFVPPEGPDAGDVRRLASFLSGGEAIVRSTSAGEESDDAAGMRLSTRSPSDEDSLRGALARVRASYPEARGALPVLVMPALRADRFGVALLTEARVLIEESALAEAVTAGEGASRTTVGRLTSTVEGPFDGALARRVRALAEAEAERFAPSPVVIEWAERGGKLWLLQARASAPIDSTQASLESVAVESGALRDEAVLLRKLDLEGVETPGTPAALRTVTDRQRRDDALGDAFAALGLPRWLAPERAVLVLGGEAFELRHAADRIARSIALATAVLYRSAGSLERLAERIAREALAPPGPLAPDARLRHLAARSIALRWLAPLLLEARDEDTNLPEPPSATLARIVANGEEIPSRFAHWAPHELDRTSPRYGPVSKEPPAVERPRAEPMSRARAELVRDHVRDLLAFEVARRGPLARAVEPSLVRPAEVRLRDVEHGFPSASPPSERGPLVWLATPRAVEGTVVTTAATVQPSDGLRIVVLETATAAQVAQSKGAAAIVVARGSALSHAAMVARSLGLPMALSEFAGELRDGQRLRVGADGAWSVEPE